MLRQQRPPLPVRRIRVDGSYELFRLAPLILPCIQPPRQVHRERVGLWVLYPSMRTASPLALHTSAAIPSCWLVVALKMPLLHLLRHQTQRPERTPLSTWIFPARPQCLFDLKDQSRCPSCPPLCLRSPLCQVSRPSFSTLPRTRNLPQSRTSG